MSLTTILKHIGTDDTGATAVEYGLIAALIVIAMLGALGQMAGITVQMWGDVQTAVTDAISG